MNDIRTALAQASESLALSDNDARLEAEILLAFVLNKNRAFLYAYPEYVLQQDQIASYQQILQQRIQGMPIAYLTGQRDFWSLTLKVNQHTLIPRHETERLVELALELLPEKDNITLLDLGTGSGAIALALAKERPHWTVLACDRSQDALNTAIENATNLGITNVTFYHSDWFTSLPNIQYHAIISNPPYITEHDPHLNQGDVRFEPLSALVSGQDGFADLHYIIRHSYDYLLPNGLLLLEHGYDQKSILGTILNGSGFINVQCWHVLLGHDRVSGGWRPMSTK